MSKSSEKNDFFVQRRQCEDELSKKAIHVIFAVMKGQDIDTSECDYMTNGNISRVRIPSILYINERFDENKPTDFEKQFLSIKKQCGAHLCMANNGHIYYTQTAVNVNNFYVVPDTRPINSVYPCYLNPKAGNRLCLGLRFSSKESGGHRSFDRLIDDQNPSNGVFDVTEDFLDPKVIKKGIEGQRDVFASGEHHYILYVCSGAKLIVEDKRFDSKRYSRSLIQSGGLVVVSGELALEVSVKKKHATKPDKEAYIGCLWNELAKNKPFILPVKGLYQNWFTQRKLDQILEQVIFLGGNESEFNQVCWRLTVSQQRGSQVISSLVAPERCRIVDIQPWDWGLVEIYWRHRYERLYEKVLFASKHVIQNPSFCFTVPNIGGNNPFYWQKKISGIGVNHSNWQMNYKYKYADRESRGHSFKEMELDRADFTVKPFPRPLYPPIFSDKQYTYLAHKTKPKYLSRDLAEIDGKIYKLHSGEDYQYLWTNPKRLAVNPMLESSANRRIGEDFMVYTKDKVIGRKKFACFQLPQSPQSPQSAQSPELPQNEDFVVKSKSKSNDLEEKVSDKKKSVVQKSSDITSDRLSDENLSKSSDKSLDKSKEKDRKKLIKMPFESSKESAKSPKSNTK